MRVTATSQLLGQGPVKVVVVDKPEASSAYVPPALPMHSTASADPSVGDSADRGEELPKKPPKVKKARNMP